MYFNKESAAWRCSVVALAAGPLVRPISFKNRSTLQFVHKMACCCSSRTTLAYGIGKLKNKRYLLSQVDRFSQK
jgi:Ca2+/H+ antiporter